MTLGVLLWLDWRLALGTLAVLMLGFAVLSQALRKRGEMARLYNDAREQVSASIVEFVQAMPVVRTFDTGYETFGRYQAGPGCQQGHADALASRVRRQLAFRGRELRYSPTGGEALGNVSFDVAPGTITALVGPP
ncbi:hypothetical protein GCM10027040_29970 [Halomonas shantousis]